MNDETLERIIQGVIDGLRPMVERPPQRFLTVNNAAIRSGLSAHPTITGFWQADEAAAESDAQVEPSLTLGA